MVNNHGIENRHSWMFRSLYAVPVAGEVSRRRALRAGSKQTRKLAHVVDQDSGDSHNPTLSHSGWISLLGEGQEIRTSRHCAASER
jgi:hypothetical protein